MVFLDNIKISKKLPILFVAIGLFAALTTAILSYLSARDGLQKESEQKLAAILTDRSVSLESWLSSIKNDIHTQSQNPTVNEALKGFKAAWAEIPENQTTYLQRW